MIKNEHIFDGVVSGLVITVMFLNVLSNVLSIGEIFILLLIYMTYIRMATKR